MSNEPLHLIGMKVQNFLKIENFDYEFDGKSVKLIGPNAAGKTSLFSAIWSACKGKHSIPPDSIHDDAEKGTIELDLGPYVVRRTITKNNAYLDITTKDGAKLMNPQTILEGLIGEIALDPHGFMDMDPKKQALSAATIFGLREDLEKVDEKIREAFEDRTYANRQAKDAEAKLKTYPKVDKTEKVDIKALTDKLVLIDNVTSEVRDLEQRGKNIKSTIETNEETIKDLERQIEHLKNKNRDHKATLDELRNGYEEKIKEAEKLPTRESIQEELDKAQETNSQAEAYAARAEAEKAAQKAKAEAEKLDKKVTDLRAKKTKVIKGAEIQIPGLTFGEEGLQLNGHPFETASYAEKLRTSIAILMAQSPRLRLLTIQDASLMDKASWKVVEDFAKDNDFQVLYEVVGERDDNGNAPKAGLYIEDGKLTAVNGKKPKASKKPKADDSENKK